MSNTVFDIIGPIMIGPSSSHTAGAVRLGRVAWKMLEDEVAEAHIQFAGSFATTGKGHGTDRAVIAGCLGMHSWYDDVPRSMEIAKEKGIEFTFENIDLPDAHPNTAIIRLVGKSGKESTVEGASIGGGNIFVKSVNGMDVEYTGQNNTILIRHIDKPGAIAAVTNFMFYAEMNIASFRMSRKKRGGEALMMIETDNDVPDSVLNSLKILPNVINVILMKKL